MILTDAPEGGKVVSIRLWNLILRNAIHLYHGGTVTCYCVLFMKYSTQIQIKLNNRQCQWNWFNYFVSYNGGIRSGRNSIAMVSGTDAGDIQLQLTCDAFLEIGDPHGFRWFNFHWHELENNFLKNKLIEHSLRHSDECILKIKYCST